MTIIYLLQKLR